MSETRLHTSVEGYFDRLKTLIDVMPVDRIEAMGEALFSAYRHGKQVFVLGNGGSAATASHMACDLGKNTIAPNVQRFRIISLTDNMPLVSALANDLGYDRVFAEQLTNLIRPGDVLIVLSGGGNSSNVLEAMRYARKRSATILALLGSDGGEAIRLADEFILVPSSDYGLVEDMHLILNHVLTSYFKARLSEEHIAAP
jgi:D-sedoheptulose 7-phosphate isomerase